MLQRSSAARAKSSWLLSTAISALCIQSFPESSFSRHFFSSMCWSAMETATCVLTWRYWFSMSRITCLIIFSGSSARSTMSLIFARISVPTRSKSPMIDLLSRTKRCKPLLPFKDNRMRLPAPQTKSGPEVHAANSRRKLRKARQRNEVQRDGPAQCIDRACPKVMEYKTECHHHEKPNEENFFFHAHGHPPRPLASRWACLCPPGRKRSLRLLDRRLRRLQLRRFVADQPHFAEQFRHLHAGERFEKRGHLRGNPGDVPGQLI